MKQLVTTLLASLLVSTTWAAGTTPSPIFSRSEPPPGVIDPGHETPPWADFGDLQGGSPAANLERWVTQANAGRARAALLAGRFHLEQVPQDPANCAKAIEWLTKADKLGSNEAAGWLGHLYRRFDCPQRDLKVAADWLRKAVPMKTFGAAGDLHDLYAQQDGPVFDLVQAYVYARVAAPEAELTNTDAGSQTRQTELAEKLSAAQRKAAGEQADKLLEGIDQRTMMLRAAPREEKLKAAASGKDWSVSLVAFDDLRECAANLAGNCKGVRRIAYYDADNRGDEYLRCKFELDDHDFGTGKLTTLTRETLLPPAAKRRISAGRIGEPPATRDLRVTCTPVAGLAANVAAGKCKAQATGTPSAADFYPPGAKRRGEEGRVLLYVYLDHKDGHPTLVDLMGSSGYPELDVAGVTMAEYMAFSSDCDSGYLPFAVAFRLQDVN